MMKEKNKSQSKKFDETLSIPKSESLCINNKICNRNGCIYLTRHKHPTSGSHSSQDSIELCVAHVNHCTLPLHVSKKNPGSGTRLKIEDEPPKRQSNNHLDQLFIFSRGNGFNLHFILALFPFRFPLRKGWP